MTRRFVRLIGFLPLLVWFLPLLVWGGYAAWAQQMGGGAYGGSGGSSVPPTFQRFTSGSGTYTTPPGVKYIWVRICGAGGGGAGSGATPTAATDGGAVTFGGVMTANGGKAGSTMFASTVVVTSTGGDLNVDGAFGNHGFQTNGTFNMPGGNGGVGPHGASGFGGGLGANPGGGAATAGSCSGGGGGGAPAAAANSGAGGSSGAYSERIFSPPLATYAYTIGAVGGGGGAGSNGQNGAQGATGLVFVREYY